jgi:hypothetical protein
MRVDQRRQAAQSLVAMLIIHAGLRGTRWSISVLTYTRLLCSRWSDSTASSCSFRRLVLISRALAVQDEAVGAALVLDHVQPVIDLSTQRLEVQVAGASARVQPWRGPAERAFSGRYSFWCTIALQPRAKAGGPRGG